MSSSDKPSDELLEDDAQLDLWFAAFVREQERVVGRKGGGNAKYDLLDEKTIQALGPDFG